jgi:hypothetical protein
MSEELQGISRAEVELAQTLDPRRFFIINVEDCEFEPDPEFEKRLREWLSPAPRPDVWEMLTNEEDISDL